MRATMRARLVLVALAAVVALPVAPAMAEGGDYQQVVDLTFPTDPRVSFGDHYHDARSGGRVHMATDLMGQKMWPLYAAVAGTICRLDEDVEDSYGRHITVCGDDGREYRYLHVNNDTPGTDDGMAGLEHVFAPGIRRGVRVARGQHIAYMGDSGNAEGSAPHLHLDLFDDTVTDPYGEHRINPYPSLVAALQRGDIPDGSAVHLDPVERVAGGDRIGTAVALVQQRFERADHVILAPAESPAEAIVAGPLASALDVPILTTWSDRLDPVAAAEVARLGATEVTLVGGLSQAVADSLVATGVPAEGLQRVAGADQFETAAAVAELVWDATTSGDQASDAPVVEGDLLPVDHTGPALLVSERRDRRDPLALDGATVGGRVRVLAGAEGEVAGVGFWIDDPDTTGEPDAFERLAPYDLGGTRSDGTAGAWDTRDLSNGEHTVTAVIGYEDGSHDTVTATFEVRNHGPRRALLALGAHPDPTKTWPDSLVASWYGSVVGAPVLLVTPEGIPSATRSALEGVAETVIVGGPSAVPTPVSDVAAALTGTVRRLAGQTRYSTATAVVDDLRGRVSAGRVWAATGTNWPDAVTAGPAVAAAGDTLVLIDGPSAQGDAETAAWLVARSGGIEEGVVIGGNAAVSPGTATEYARRIT